MSTAGQGADVPPRMVTRRRSDPFVTGTAVLGGLVVIGFVAIALGKRSLARTPNVAFQLPGLVSGCLGGLALIVVGAGLAVVLHGRRVEAALHADTERVLDEAAALVAAVRAAREPR